MTLNDILEDIHALNEDLETFERKYGVLSETFYEFYQKGEEPERQEWVLDFADWAGAYKIWLRRQQQYREAVTTLKSQVGSVSELIGRTARREPLTIPA